MPERGYYVTGAGYGNTPHNGIRGDSRSVSICLGIPKPKDFAGIDKPEKLWVVRRFQSIPGKIYIER